MQKCEQINDLGITVNSAFTPSANVLTATNKVRGMLYFIKRSLTCVIYVIFVRLNSASVWPHFEYGIQAIVSSLKKDINLLERMQRAATRWVKDLRGVTYEKRLRALKLHPLEKNNVKK